MLSSKSAIPISLDADASRQLPARIEFYVGSITHGEPHHFLHTGQPIFRPVLAESTHSD